MKRLKKIGWKRALLILVLALLAFFLPPLPQQFRDLKADSSLVLTDRHGIPLRRQLSEREGVNSWLSLHEMGPTLRTTVVRAEDKRFYYHPGLDPVAVMRSVWLNLRDRKVVSGASTITQQLLRTLSPPGKRTLARKLVDSYWAVRLECRYSKEEILEAYLNRVAFGPNVYGVREASRYYFDKPPASLSVAECAALAVTIRSPITLDPFTQEGGDELRRWTGPLISSLRKDHLISAEAAERAQSEQLELSPDPPPFLAPHFCDLLLSQPVPGRGTVTTTLDLELQETVEGLVKSHLALLKEHNVGNAAVVVAEVESGDVLAMVGSGSYHRRRDGQHNAAVALRQPGSTLKPFTYALLLERVGQAGFILPDLNLYQNADKESFVPKNYDKHFHGPVSIRTSLACSYNVPAVRALERVGPENLLLLLRRLGFSDLTEPPEHYGLGLTLGDGSASLTQLVGAYRALARGGVYAPLRYLTDEPRPLDAKVLDPRCAYLITDILSDKNARIPSFGTPNVLEFPFPVAVKTGTSKGYRDNWTVGYTPKYVVGVWVGNSDGQPMRDVSGISGAGPLFRDVMLNLGDEGQFPSPPLLEEIKVCALSGLAAGAICPNQVTEKKLKESRIEACEVCRKEKGSSRIVFDLPPLYHQWAAERGLPQASAKENQGQGLRFVFPLTDDVFIADPDLPPENQRVKIRAVGGSGPYLWYRNGRRLEQTAEPSLWWQLAPGSHELEVEDSSGARKKLHLRVVGKIRATREEEPFAASPGPHGRIE